MQLILSLWRKESGDMAINGHISSTETEQHRPTQLQRVSKWQIPVALWYLGPFPEFYYSVHHCWNSLGVLHSHALELWHSYLVYGKINTHINFRKGFFLLNQVVTWRFFPNMKNRLSIKCWIGALKRNPESNTTGWQVGMWWALMWHHYLDIERGTGPQEG